MKKESARGLLARKSKRLEVDFDDLHPPFPREVFFDITNACNSRCFFCSNSKLARHDYLDKDFGFKLLRDFFDCGARDLALFATGEPFLHPDLPEFVREAKRVGYEYVFLNSNGIAAAPDRARPVLEAGLDSIKFSVNAGRRETYAKVHGVDKFDQVIRNIRWFHEYRIQSGRPLRIYVSMVTSSRTQDEYPLLAALLEGAVDEIDRRGCSNQGGNMLENNTTEAIDKGNLLGSLRKGSHSGRCPDVFSRCTVTPQGYLTACVVDYRNFLVLADLHEVPVREAWDGEAYVALRRRHSERKLDGLVCYNCLNNCAAPVAPLDPRYVIPLKAQGARGEEK